MFYGFGLFKMMSPGDESWSYKVIEEPPTTFLRCSASACLLETGCRQYIINHSSGQGAVAYLRTCFLKPSTVRLSLHKIILEATHHHCQK